MTTPDMIAAIGVFVAALTFIYTLIRYQIDASQQQAAKTREELRAIIGDCNKFLRPLSQNYPYPIFHTAAAITKEFCSRMSNTPQHEEIQKILSNKELLLSICVEGWVSSTQIGHMLDIVEELERKATTRYVRGKLLLICHSSLMLAGLVAKVCSPESFYKLLSEINLPTNSTENVEDDLNAITIELQRSICNSFTSEYQEAIKCSLYFIQTAANAFINLKDEKLIKLTKDRGLKAPDSNVTDPSIKTSPIVKIEESALLSNRVMWVHKLLDGLEGDINNNDFDNLCELIHPIENACIIVLEGLRTK